MVAIVRRGPVGDNSEGDGESPLSQVRAEATHVHYNKQKSIYLNLPLSSKWTYLTNCTQ